MGYSQSGAPSGLLIDKSNADDLIRGHSNVLIRESKLVDEGVTGVEALEWWQRLKVHGMPSTALFGEGKMELLCREIESSTGIRLKTLIHHLIDRLGTRQKESPRLKIVYIPCRFYPPST